MIVIVFTFFIIILSLFLEYFERKVRARIQQRIGPLYTGPFGLLQPVADLLKLIFKDEVTSIGSDWQMSLVSTFFILSSSLFLNYLVPIGFTKSILDTEYNLIFFIALTTFYSLSVGMLGFSSVGPYEIVGIGRALQQIVSYEVPLVISILSPSLLVGSFYISDIIRYPKKPLIFLLPISFFVSLVSVIAKLEKVPFDVPEAETELGAGWLTELSAWKLASIRLANDLSLLANCSLIVDLFLGGSNSYFFQGYVIGFILFTIKLLFVAFLLTFISSVLARYRIDQLIYFFWKYLTPLAIFQLLILFILKIFLGW